MRDQVDDELLHGVFSGEEWREAADAIFEVSGVVISVNLPAGGRVPYASSRCAYCELQHPSVDTDDAEGWACLVQTDEIGAGEATCFSGLPCRVGEVRLGERTVAHVAVGGFISATRERRLLTERLAAAGAPADKLCKAVRKIPVLPRRRIDAILKLLCAHAETLVARASEARSSGSRVRELEIFLDAGREFLQVDSRGGDLEQRIIDRAVHFVDGASGVLGFVRPGTDLIDVVAVAGAPEGRIRGDVIRVGDDLEGEAVRSGSTLVFSERKERAGTEECLRNLTISVPIRGSRGFLGSITVQGVTQCGRDQGEAARFLERYATVAASVVENTRTGHANRRALEGLTYVSGSAKALAPCATCQEVARVATGALEEMLDVRLCGIVLTAWGYDTVHANVRGHVSHAAFEGALAEAAGRVVADEPFESVHVSAGHGSGIIESDAEGPWFDGPVLSVPLAVGGLVAGYAFAALPGAGRFCGSDESLLREVGEHIASALGRASEWERLRQDQSNTIAALAAALDSAERAEPGHTDRIVGYALALGSELGLPTEDLRTLRFAAVVHDIGAVGITPGVLGKTDRLTPEEMEEVRNHPVIGADIVGQLKHLDAVTPAVKHHHERWDGAGYPFGIGGTDIPLLARVLAVADAFDSMTSPRRSEQRLSVAEARRELQRGAGTHFDPEAVTAFLTVLDRQVLAGMTGLLADRAPQREPTLPA